MGGPDAVAKVHARGKLTARERVALLLDPESFQEIGLLAEGVVQTPGKPPQRLPADGVVTGWGTINGRPVCVVADDGTLLGAAAGLHNIEKRFRMRRLALTQGCPFVGLYEGSAIRFQDSMQARLMSQVPAFTEVMDCVGIIPQVAAMLGACFGRPPIDGLYADLTLMAEGTGFVGWSGPTLVRGGLGEEVSIDRLAGPDMHARTTGFVDLVPANEHEGIASIKEFLAFLPQNCWELPPQAPVTDDPNRLCPELLDLVPTNPRKPYDMTRVIAALVDHGHTFVYKSAFGQSVLTCLARLAGRVVGLVASQPEHQAGALDWGAAAKIRRFIAVCDSFHIPLIFLQDQPGFLIGSQAEAANMLYWGGTVIEAVQRATVPKIIILLRKAHGAAMWAMGGRGSATSPDLQIAWPLTLMTGTGPTSAVYTVHSKELQGADDPEQLQRELEARYSSQGSVYEAAAVGGVDDIIEPPETRRYLIRALAFLCQKQARSLGPKRRLFS
jgi:acetyl-CoA carboxylase carboxyltransferase component